MERTINRDFICCAPTSFQDLLAVGYGNLENKSEQFGKVCIWSPKNPVHPEREYTLDQCVTAISYSNTRPNILAVGCLNGDVFVADISADGGHLRALGRCSAEK